MATRTLPTYYTQYHDLKNFLAGKPIRQDHWDDIFDDLYALARHPRILCHLQWYPTDIVPIFAAPRLPKRETGHVFTGIAYLQAYSSGAEGNYTVKGNTTTANYITSSPSLTWYTLSITDYEAAGPWLSVAYDLGTSGIYTCGIAYVLGSTSP